MSKGQKHHFVPEVYLKRFAQDNTGLTNSLVIKPLLKSARAKPTNTSKICYQRDMFRMQTNKYHEKRLIDNPYYIEQNAFAYENRQLVKLFNLIEYKKPVLISEACELLKIIFSIKRRNPQFGDNFTTQKVQNHTNEVTNSIFNELTQKVSSVPNSEMNIQNTLNKLLLELESEDYVKDIYRKLLLEIKEDKNPDEIRRLNNFVNLKFNVLRTSFDAPFITSDNPGFTIQDGTKFFNLNLGFVQEFVFPLSPTSLLLIDFRIKDPVDTIYKRISYNTILPNQVNYYNLGTCFLCKKRIISYNSDQLEIAKNILLVNNSASDP